MTRIWNNGALTAAALLSIALGFTPTAADA